jgi:hypothetical protein
MTQGSLESHHQWHQVATASLKQGKPQKVTALDDALTESESCFDHLNGACATGDLRQFLGVDCSCCQSCCCGKHSTGRVRGIHHIQPPSCVSKKYIKEDLLFRAICGCYTALWELPGLLGVFFSQILWSGTSFQKLVFHNVIFVQQSKDCGTN